MSTILLTQASLKITQAVKKRGYNTLQVASSTRLKTTSNTRTQLCMRDDDTIGNILDVIDYIKSDLKTLKALVQQAISKEQLGAPFVEASYYEGISQGPGTNDSILVDAEILEDSKPAAKLSNKEQCLAAQQRAREWAKTESKKKQIKKP